MNNYLLIDQNFEEIIYDNPIDKIAFVAHNCYQVKEKDHQHNIEFLQRLINAKHFAMLEHFMYTFKIDETIYKDIVSSIAQSDLYRFIRINKEYLSFSPRNVCELVLSNSKEDNKIGYNLLNIIDDETKELIIRSLNLSLVNVNDCSKYSNAKRIKEISFKNPDFSFVTIKLLTNRGVSHEIVRHRVCSFAQESTRYCNYTKDKFNNCLRFIKPLEYEKYQKVYDNFFKNQVDTYFKLIELTNSNDIARNVLANSLATKIVVSCSLTEWKHIFELRCQNSAHPDIRVLMQNVEKYITEKYKGK